jgi:RHS repeat-associated protein
MEASKRKFDGKEYDSLRGLQYMQARYENPMRGQFISEDASFLAMGDRE